MRWSRAGGTGWKTFEREGDFAPVGPIAALHKLRHEGYVERKGWALVLGDTTVVLVEWRRTGKRRPRREPAREFAPRTLAPLPAL